MQPVRLARLGMSLRTTSAFIILWSTLIVLSDSSQSTEFVRPLTPTAYSTTPVTSVRSVPKGISFRILAASKFNVAQGSSAYTETVVMSVLHVANSIRSTVTV